MGVRRTITIYCNGRTPYPGTEFGVGCYREYQPPDDATYKQTSTPSGLRRLAKRDGWTHVPRRIAGHDYSDDFCPEHKPEPKDGSDG